MNWSLVLSIIVFKSIQTELKDKIPHYNYNLFLFTFIIILIFNKKLQFIIICDIKTLNSYLT